MKQPVLFEGLSKLKERGLESILTPQSVKWDEKRLRDSLMVFIERGLEKPEPPEDPDDRAIPYVTHQLAVAALMIESYQDCGIERGEQDRFFDIASKAARHLTEQVYGGHNRPDPHPSPTAEIYYQLLHSRTIPRV